MSWRGSYTIEAAVIMGVFCLMTVTLIQQGYRIHDETTGKMALHECVEKARHERKGSLEETEEWGRARQGLKFSFEGFQVELKENGKNISGSASARERQGIWNVQIEAGIFEPEVFLRKTEAVKQLEDGVGNSL